MNAVLQYALGRPESALKIGPFFFDIEQAWVFYDTGRWGPAEYEELPTRLRTLLPLIGRARAQVGRLARARARLL